MNHTHPPAGAPARAGAALILALVVLAALILMGIPFLMSQSVSLSGSMSFKARMAAGAARDSAESIGLAVGAEAAATPWLDPSIDRSLLHEDFENAFAGATVTRSDDQPQTAVIDLAGDADLDSFATGGGDLTTTRIGLRIEDDSGRLDVNDLDAAAWDRLLTAVLGPDADWDDDEVIDSDGGESADPDDPSGDDDDNGGSIYNDDNDDGNGFGELAEALANRRYALDGARITDLAQLLDADPGHNDEILATGDDPYANNHGPVTGSFGFRVPLTAHELRLLAPYLTVHARGQGRRGRIDAGTVIDAGSGVIDSGAFADGMTGTHFLAFESETAGDFDADAQWRSGDHWQSAHRRRGTPVDNLAPGTALQIEVPSPVNLSHAPAPVVGVVTGTANPPGDLATWDDLTGVAASSGTGYHRIAPWTTGRLLPPADIRSFGILRIASSATASDNQGRPVASVQRRIVASALPYRKTLTARWQTQGAYEVPRARGHVSRMVSWPAPLNRLADAAPVTDPAVPEQALIAEALPTFASTRGQPVRRFWSRPLRARDGSLLADRDTALSWGDRSADPTAGDGDGDMLPDGLRLGGNGLAYAIDPGEGPVQGTGDLDLIDGHHVGLWFRIPEDDSWSDEVPIITMRAPDGNCYPQLDGTPGSNEFQNLWKLHYDTDAGYLVLTLANPAIERTVRATRGDGRVDHVAEDLFGDGTTLFVNEQCFGLIDDDAGGDLPPLAPEQPWNHARFLYKVDPGFAPGRWYHLQVIVAHDRPGGQAILVDGFAGRDLSDPAHQSGTVAHGDHLTLPSMALATELPRLDLPADDAADGMELSIGDIDLDDTPIHRDPAATDLLDRDLDGSIDAADTFPTRGTVLIGDEYISYTGIDGNRLTGCYRGLRANTNTDAGDPARHLRWPVTQAHARGELVVPGGYRVATGGRLYTGETTPLENVPNGDPDLAADSRQWTVWSRADQTSLPATHRETIGTDTYYILGTADDGGTEAPLTGFGINGDGVPTQFPTGPARLRIEGQHYADDGSPVGNRVRYFYVDDFDGVGSFTDIELLDAAGLDRADPTTALDARQLRFHSGDPPTVTCTSIAVGDPLDGQRFEQTGGVMQVGHAGRIEWIAYDRTWSYDTGTVGGDRWFFLDESGFDRNHRGRERTAFAGDTTLAAEVADDLDPFLDRYSSAPRDDNNLLVFPADSRILPVQNDFGSTSWLATGDVVTIMPDSVAAPDPSGDPARQAVQMVIRYAATDGYRTADRTTATDSPIAAVADHDSKNEWFTFTEAVPHPWQGSQVQLLSGLCWSGASLAGYSNAAPTPTRGMMPSLKAIDPDYGFADDTDDADAEWQLFRDADTTAPVDVDGIMTGALALADADADGALADADADYRLSKIDGGPGVLAADATGSELRFAGDLLRTNSITPDVDYALMLLGSEIIAVEREGDNRAIVIARGLLGTTAAEHRVTETRDHEGDIRTTRGPTAFSLPGGPVGRLRSALAADHLGEVDFTTKNPPPPNSNENPRSRAMRFAPAALLIKRDHTLADHERYEFVILSQERRSQRRYFTAPWLRGAYASTVQDFAPDDLIIGWWPRYPSALPPPAECEPAHYRSRSYAWAGFPLRFYDTWFEGAEVSVDPADLGGGTAFDCFARALAAGRDWTTTDADAVLVGGAGVDAGAVFAHPSFTDGSVRVPVDGGELRLTWHYPSTLYDTADDGPQSLDALLGRTVTTPAIEGVAIEASSGIRILGREDTP